jgi:hypothetical protein
VQPLDRLPQVFQAFSDDGVIVHRSAGKLNLPVYYVAMCAASETVLPALRASFFQPEKLDLLHQYVSYAKWAINSDRELKESLAGRTPWFSNWLIQRKHLRRMVTGKALMRAKDPLISQAWSNMRTIKRYVRQRDVRRSQRMGRQVVPASLN